MSDRGQAFTLEAVVAALLLLAALFLALTASGTAPADVTERRLESEQRALVAGALDAAPPGAVRRAALYYNDSVGRFHGTGPEGTYPMGGPPTAFGATLNRTLGERGVLFNVAVTYVARDGSVRTEQMVHMGTPADGGVRVVETVTLYDDDVLRGPDGAATDVTLAEADRFYAPDAAPDSPVYNVVQVEVVAWRT